MKGQVGSIGTDQLDHNGEAAGLAVYFNGGDAATAYHAPGARRLVLVTHGASVLLKTVRLLVNRHIERAKLVVDEIM